VEQKKRGKSDDRILGTERRLKGHLRWQDRGDDLFKSEGGGRAERTEYAYVSLLGVSARQKLDALVTGRSPHSGEKKQILAIEPDKELVDKGGHSLAEEQLARKGGNSMNVRPENRDRR